MTVHSFTPTLQQPNNFIQRALNLRKTSDTTKPSRPLTQFSENFESIRNSISLEGHQEFTILKTLKNGNFSKIFLARPDHSCNKHGMHQQALVLKAFNAGSTPREEFFAEMELNYFLSPHPSIVTSYNVSFTWKGCHIYPQEYAPYGDLTKYLCTPLSEAKVKLVAAQISCALNFIHGLNLVHRDVVPENVLVFQRDLSVVKLSDFGSMVTARALLTKGSECNISSQEEDERDNLRPTTNSNGGKGRAGVGSLGYVPPEICGILPQEKYHCYSSVDVWQLGILIFTCLVGNCPWKMADCVRDPGFSHYCDWVKRRCIKTPVAFQPFSGRFVRLLKRMLEPKPTKRCAVQEVTKYLKDEWLVTSFKGMEKSPSFNALSEGQEPKRAATIGPYKKTSTRRSESVRGRGRVTTDGKIERKDPVFKMQCSFHGRNKAQQ